MPVSIFEAIVLKKLLNSIEISLLLVNNLLSTFKIFIVFFFKGIINPSVFFTLGL